MTNCQFHDALLKEGNIPVEMIRAGALRARAGQKTSELNRNSMAM
jgi:hypothetical protein